jgi:hypothetical protein
MDRTARELAQMSRRLEEIANSMPAAATASKPVTVERLAELFWDLTHGQAYGVESALTILGTRYDGEVFEALLARLRKAHERARALGEDMAG